MSRKRIRILALVTVAFGAVALLSAQSAVGGANQSGLLVISVDQGGPAEKAGIARGDVLLSIDGTATNSTADMMKALDGKRAGQTVPVKIKHGDAEKTLALTIEDRLFKSPLGLVLETGPGFPGNLGSGMMRGFNGQLLKPIAQVSKVETGSPASGAGIKADDMIIAVNGDKFTAEKDLAAVIASRKPGDTVTLTIRRGTDKDQDMKVTLGSRSDDKTKAYLGVSYAMVPDIASIVPNGLMKRNFDLPKKQRGQNKGQPVPPDAGTKL